MKLYTRQFGELMVPQEKVIRFERGIVGFPDYKRFFLVDAEDTSPFLWLVCLDEPEFGLPLLPGALIEGYIEDLRPYLDDGNWAVYLVVTLSDSPERATVNLKGPILIDVRHCVGRQVVVDSENFRVAHPLFSVSVQRAAIDG
ncbi:MAG TPA: hypothetical protein EYP17_05870 [Candidatus Latescibacteria bacterium]|nr:hypothetical protein [Candidatus Latescibacterota bacterium]